MIFSQFSIRSNIFVTGTRSAVLHSACRQYGPFTNLEYLYESAETSRISGREDSARETSICDTSRCRFRTQLETSNLDFQQFSDSIIQCYPM